MKSDLHNTQKQGQTFCTPHCKHEGSCGSNICVGFVSVFKWTFFAKYMANKALSFSQIKKSKNPMQLLFGMKANEDNIKFAVTFALINATYKFVLCFIRHLHYQGPCPDKWAAPLAGMLSAFWMGLDEKKRRQFIIILLLSKLIDILLNLWIQNANKSKRAEQANTEGKDTFRKHFLIVVLFQFCLVVHMYCGFFEPDTLNRQMMIFTIKFCKMGINFRQITK